VIITSCTGARPVARKLVGVVFDGEQVPPGGSVVRAGDREVGRVTSSAMSPALNRPIALAYLHRDFVTPGVAVSADGINGVVAEVPFVSR
jgi:glycine cleavage system aminomethyltransferase T